MRKKETIFLHFLLVLAAACNAVAALAYEGKPAEIVASADSTEDPDIDLLQTAKRRAERGDADAQTLLGSLYLTGKGVQKDYAQAAYWFLKAAEQDQTEAQFVLGGMYRNGMGVRQDDTQAVDWYRRAAEQGHMQAQASLSSMYADGKGVP